MLTTNIEFYFSLKKKFRRTKVFHRTVGGRWWDALPHIFFIVLYFLFICLAWTHPLHHLLPLWCFVKLNDNHLFHHIWWEAFLLTFKLNSFSSKMLSNSLFSAWRFLLWMWMSLYLINIFSVGRAVFLTAL